MAARIVLDNFLAGMFRVVAGFDYRRRSWYDRPGKRHPDTRLIFSIIVCTLARQRLEQAVQGIESRLILPQPDLVLEIDILQVCRLIRRGAVRDLKQIFIRDIAGPLQPEQDAPPPRYGLLHCPLGMWYTDLLHHVVEEVCGTSIRYASASSTH